MSIGVADSLPVIVVADRDDEVRETVTGFMSARGYRVEPAADAATAAAILMTERVEVLISDLALRRDDGVDMLSYARAAAPATRSIALASNATPRERDAALRLGAVRVLAKPLSLLELADAIGIAHDCADGFHGWMHRLSLVDVLQMYHHAGESLVLQIRGDVEGAIAMRRGELIDAEHAGHTGMHALIQLLAGRRGELETRQLPDGAVRTIAGPFDHVLLDGLRSIDELRNPPGAALTAVSFDAWIDEMTERDPLDRSQLVRWISEHAPGAGVWRIDPGAPSIERLDELGAHPEIELAGTPGSLGWAYELAELTEPGWTRVELTSGSTAIALVRVPGVVLAFARMITGDAVKRRFHVESAQLVRWLYDHVGLAR